MTDETVAVLGAGGTMGFPMARNLARAGFTVRAWNRSKEKAQPLSDDGATVCDSPAEAADGAGILLTILADTDAVIDTIQSVVERTQQDVVWLQMSTIGEEGTGRCAELAEKHGLAFLDAPVLGTKKPAEDGKLVVLASGSQELAGRVEPLFDVLGQRTIWVGEAGAGTRLKLVTNSWVLTVVEGTAETMALAQGLGLDPKLLFQALEGGTLELPYLRMKGEAILNGDFTPMFKLALAAKDAGLVEAAAQNAGLDLPLFSTIRRRMEEGIPEHGDEDMIATYWSSAPKAAASP